MIHAVRRNPGDPTNNENTEIIIMCVIMCYVGSLVFHSMCHGWMDAWTYHDT